MNQASELDVLDYRASLFDGCTFRAYSEALPTSYSTVPSGTKLSEFVLPSPAYNSAVWDTNELVARATMRSTWQDNAADAGGTFGCYTITNPSGTIIDRGTMGIAGSGATCIVNAATVAAGAPFSIIENTLEHSPLP